MPSSEDILAKLSGGKVFSKQVQVYEECSKLLTINSNKGLFKFKQLQFGVKVVLSIFQQIMDSILAGLDFAIAYLNNELIKSENHRQQCEYIKKSIPKNTISNLAQEVSQFL